MERTWFEQLFGFAEGPYAWTREQLTLDGERLGSKVNGRSFGAGTFTTPTLASLREQTEGARRGDVLVRHEVIGDVLELHSLPSNAGAMFQAASQFNCLEFAGPEELPEDGVTQYATDPTQGPACALAAAAGTVVRNYFAVVDGQSGQTRDRQINNLRGVMSLLDPSLLDVRNGYTFSDAERLVRLEAKIAATDRQLLLGALRIGVQAHAQVTFQSRFVELAPREQYVSQAYCSAISCGYNGGGPGLWEPIASLVLEATYEATLRAAILDAERGSGSGRVWLTFIGGGVFANESEWIGRAMVRALATVQGAKLDVRIGHYQQIDRAIEAAVQATGSRS